MKAAIYMRVSTLDQVDNFSIPAQLKALREYCLKNGIEIYREYCDEGISGTKEDRPQFQEMINDAPNFDIILVHKFDRFARKIELSHRIKAQLKKHHVNVISITEPVEDSPIGFFQEGLLELLAEYYVRNLSKEVKKGHIERASQGLYNGSLPYGYYAKDGKLYIKENEAEIVRLIFEKYLQGMGCQSLALYLQDNRILTQKNKSFQYFQVWRILQNPKYIGLIEYDGKLYQGQHEPIIDQEIFDKVQREMRSRNTNPNAGRNVQRSVNYYKWHMIDVLHCGACGGAMRIIYHTSKIPENKGKWHSYSYACTRALRYNRTCSHNKSYKAEKLEAEIQGIIKEFMRGNTKIDLHLNVRNENKENDFLYNRIEKIKQELDRAKQAYLAGVFDLEEYKTTKDNLDKEMKEVKSEMSKPKIKQNTSKILLDKLSNVWEYYVQEQDICTKRAILKSIFDRIEIDSGNCRFYFEGNCATNYYSYTHYN